MATNSTPVHPDPKVQQRRWWILAILSISVFLVVVDNLIINVAIPTLARELEATTSGLQWIVDSYALVFAGLLLACGGLGDRFGRKIVMQIGMVLFGVFSAWAAFTDTTEQLIIGRGPLLLGVLHDFAGGYRSSYLAAGACSLVGALLFSLAGSAGDD